MSTFPATQALRVAGEPVYIHKPCLEAMTWGPVDAKTFGPIKDQGCDRCECGADGQWAEVRIPL